jgi:hypothetical protein
LVQSMSEALVKFCAGTNFHVLRGLFEATRQRHSAVFRALLCAIATARPVDLNSGCELVEGSNGESVLSPIAVVASVVRPEDVADGRAHLRALAALLTSRETATALRHESFYSVLSDAVRKLGATTVDDALRRQLLPSSEFLLEKKPDWRGFMAARLDALALFLRDEFDQPMLEQQQPV